jgi:hypothetical protein
MRWRYHDFDIHGPDFERHPPKFKKHRVKVKKDHRRERPVDNDSLSVQPKYEDR